MSKPYRPSNGTEGDFFIEVQCGGCVKRKTCRIPRLTMLYDEAHPLYPKEWVSDDDGQNLRCTAREILFSVIVKS